MKGSDSKEMKRTGTNPGSGNELQRTTSSYHGSVSDQVRYSDRATAADKNNMTASDLHKSKTLQDRIAAANKANAKTREE
ncbi:hypothetical protein CBS101457_002065 [Exobasidium rhododendri]|nr:hypothetical protein CBS101457_002065 [Exobasidium rhododendri]